MTDFSDPQSPQECRIEVYSPEFKRTKTVLSGKIRLDKMIREPVATNVPQPFAERYHWDVSPNGEIIIGYSGKYEVDIYDEKGEKLRSFARKHTPVPVTKKDREDFFDSLSTFSSDGSVSREVPDYIKKHAVFPPDKPVFRDIVVDYQGNILVCLHQKTREEELRTFDVFDPEGNFIASVRLGGDNPPPVSSRLRADTGGFWWCHTDAEGLPVVSKWKMAGIK